MRMMGFFFPRVVKVVGAAKALCLHLARTGDSRQCKEMPAMEG